MVRTFKITNIVKTCESPFILALNDTNFLIGNKARALQNYVQEGMNVSASGYLRDSDFLIETLNFLDGVKKGAQIDIVA
jgi:hypothetical protein